MAEQLYDISDLVERGYNSVNPTRKYIHGLRCRIIESFVKGIANSNMRVLEIGTGAGTYLPFLKKKFNSVISLDIDFKFLAFASDKSSAALVQGDVFNLPFKDNRFDLVIFSEVLEHLIGPETALAEIKRVKKESGFMIISTPQKYSLFEFFGRIARKQPFKSFASFIYPGIISNPGHINLFTRAKLEKLFGKLGFEIIDKKRSGLYLPVCAEFGGTIAVFFSDKLERFFCKLGLASLLQMQIFILK
jgi:ubiquinone/menaquinone biosynthesis C-methylase UbiE